jgi:acetyl-CoA C-acetyltransferase
MGNSALIDSMVHDGLTDPIHFYSMGITAESIAARWSIDRATQDAFAAESHHKASVAQRNGSFHPEIVAVEVPVKTGSLAVDTDEGVRAETGRNVLAQLRPAFRQGGVVTAGNASGLNDGAAMLAVSSDEYARAHGIQPLATILSYATIGVDPAYMGMGPAAAIPLALQRAGLAVDDVDLFELNEAFAAQCVAVCRELRIPEDRVNVRGGAIALGHPIGASGARLIVTLTHALRSMNKQLGIASLCIGGGMGVAMVLRSA